MIRLLWLLLILPGCAPAPEAPRVGDAVTVEVRGYAGYVQVVEVDGVRCAVLVGYQKGALDCDFGEGE